MPSPISASTLAKNIREKGVRWLLTKLFTKFIYKKQEFILLSYELATKQKEYRQSSRWDIRTFTSYDLDTLGTYLPKYKNAYRELLEMGCIAYAAFEKATGHAIAIICFTDKDFYDHHYMHHLFTVAPGEIYQFAGEVALKYRNTAVSINVLKIAWQDWLNKGKTKVYSAVDLENAPSLKYLVHLRFREMGQLLTVHRLFHRKKWSSISSYSGQKLATYYNKAGQAD